MAAAWGFDRPHLLVGNLTLVARSRTEQPTDLLRRHCPNVLSS